MPVDVKICGLSTPETVTRRSMAGADLVGFVFYPQESAQCVARRKPGSLPPGAGPREDRGAYRRCRRHVSSIRSRASCDPDLFQAHGGETPERIAEIGTRTGKPVIKAIKIRTEADVAEARAYERQRPSSSMTPRRRRPWPMRCRAAMALPSTGRCSARAKRARRLHPLGRAQSGKCRKAPSASPAPPLSMSPRASKWRPESRI